MRIVILAPTHKSFIGKFLSEEDSDKLPEGYFGAPFLGVLIQELLRKGHYIVSITTTVANDGDYTVKEFRHGNFKWIVVPARKHTIRFNQNKLGKIVDFYAFEQRLLKKATLGENPDFVHAHWSYEFAGALKGINIPNLVTIHDNPYQVLKYMSNAYRLGRLFMSELILRQVKFASTISPYMLKYCQNRCHEVKVIPNPVAISSSKENINSYIVERLRLISSPNIVMVMNGWDKRKNGNVGLKAFKLIKRVIPNATLHLFGNGSEINGPAFKSATSLQLQGVIYNGPVTHNSLINELRNMHLMIHPSLEESFGVVLIEAMALGVPVLGGATSGAVPWVIGISELLINVSNEDPVALKAIQILTNPKLYGEYSQKCFLNVANRFSASSVAQSYEEYYRQIIASKKSEAQNITMINNPSL